MQLWRQQLLLFLCSLDTKAEIQQTEYFNHHQVECAKQVAALMTGHQTIEQLTQTVVLVFLARPISSLMQAPAEALDLTTGYAYLKGFAPEAIFTAILFSMIGYFNGSDKTIFVMVQGLFQTLLVRLPMAYIMSIQPNASLTMIGLAAPTSTAVGVLLKMSASSCTWTGRRKSRAERIYKRDGVEHTPSLFTCSLNPPPGYPARTQEGGSGGRHFP